MIHKSLRAIEEVPYSFSTQFQSHTGQKIVNVLFILALKVTRWVAAIKSLRFTLFHLTF